jgi:hypothetical protein
MELIAEWLQLEYVISWSNSIVVVLGRFHARIEWSRILRTPFGFNKYQLCFEPEDPCAQRLLVVGERTAFLPLVVKLNL